MDEPGPFGRTSEEPRQLTEDDQKKLEKQNLVSDFKREKYEREAARNWNHFYKRNKDNFFKDRNWSIKDIEELCAGDINFEENIVFLEAGCGVGNMLFPLQAAFPHMRLQAFDFSQNALNLLNERANQDGIEVSSCVVDLTDSGSASFSEQADLATLIFVLSAIHPDKHRAAANNLSKYIRIGGSLLIRDYAVNDYAMIRFTRNAKLGERFYVRQDGTRAFYFYIEELVNIFEEAGFECKRKEYLHRQTINFAKNLSVPRVFVQARFVKSLSRMHILRLSTEELNLSAVLLNGQSFRKCTPADMRCYEAVYQKEVTIAMSLLLVMGLPAAGKSSLCEKLTAAPHSKHIIVIEFDKQVGRKVEAFNAAETRHAFEQTVWQRMQRLGNDWQGVLIIDDIFYLRSMRRPFERAARKLGWRFAVLVVKCELQRAIERNAQRPTESRVDEKSIRRIASEIELPDDAIIVEEKIDREEILDTLEKRERLKPSKNLEVKDEEREAKVKSLKDSQEQTLRGCIAELVAEGYDGRKLAVAKKQLRWIRDSEHYYGACYGRLWKVWRVDDEKIGYKVLRRSLARKAVDDHTALERYFQSHVGMKDLYSVWIEKDSHVKRLLSGNELLKGVRILDQEPIETIFAFICSANNNIARISKMVNRLCELYGKEFEETADESETELKIIEKHPFLKFDFPVLKQLAAQTEGMETLLRDEGFGYRAAYLRNTVIKLAELGEAEIMKWREEEAEQVREKLLELSGVGPKVADCIGLMALQKHHVVPIDTHVFEVTRKIYLPNLIGKSLNANLHKTIGKFYEDKFGEYAGWAQAVLFNAQLGEKTNNKNKAKTKKRKLDEINQ